MDDIALDRLGVVTGALAEYFVGLGFRVRPTCSETGVGFWVRGVVPLDRVVAVGETAGEMWRVFLFSGVRVVRTTLVVIALSDSVGVIEGLVREWVAS